MKLLAENYTITKMSVKWVVLFFYPQEVVLRTDIKVKVIVKRQVLFKNQKCT